MRLDEQPDVRPAKFAELKLRLARLGIDPAAIQEQFVKGGGKGGSKINKTSSCVVMSYPPLGVRVRVQRDRRRSMNRFFALRLLLDKIEQLKAGTR